MPSFRKIATARSTNNNVNFQFTSIPSTYQHLVIYAYVRSNRATTNDPIVLSFNGTSAGQSRRVDLDINSSAVNLSLTSAAWAAVSNGAPSTANVWGHSVIHIGGYAINRSGKRTFVSYGVGETSSTSSGYLRGINGGALDVTAALTSITLTPFSATYWATGSYAVLYGFES